MKLASLTFRDRDVVAVQIGERELAAVDDLVAVPGKPAGAALDMLDVIRGGAPLLAGLRAALESSRGDRSIARFDVDSVAAWHPPVRRPGKICAVAMNNSASNERKVSAPNHPAFFLKPSSCLVGHGQPIRVRRYYGSVHPEPELALVIGEETRDIPAKRALDAVFGYTIFDDITGNGMRAEDRFHYWAVYAKKG